MTHEAHEVQAALLAAGLSHEGRNILQRSQAALERLHWRVQDRPEALDLLSRVQRAQDDLAHLFETLRDYLAPVSLCLAPHDLPAIWRDAWDQLTAAQPPRDARLVEETAEGDLCCQVDRPRLTQAFRYLLHSALVSSSNPPHVTICCREGELAGEPAVEVSLRDQGPALSDEQRQQLFEPFAAPRPRRCGLGLAAARKIIEAHGGRIVAQPADGAGALVLITLPRRMS